MRKITLLISCSFILALTLGLGAANADDDGIPDRGPIPFSAYDKDGDGVITEEEFDAIRAQRMQQGGGQGQCRGKGQGKGQGKGMGKGRDVPSFEDFDADGDEFISEQEFNDARAKRMTERAKQGKQMKGMTNAPSFADIDTDGDGKISRAEFAVHQEECRGAMSK